MPKRVEKNEGELQLLAAFVHGALFGLHALGVAYNVKRKNWQAAAIHFSVGLWDGIATFKHVQKAKD